MRAQIALLVVLVTTQIAVAQPEPGTYRLVPGRSAARLAVASPVGTARLTVPADGEVVIGAGGAVSGGQLVLDTQAMRADALVLQQMRGPEGFDVAQYPRATVAIEGGTVDAARLTLEGRLTVRGTTRPVRLSGEVLREQGRRLSAELAGAIDRTRFGIVAGRPLYARSAEVRLRLVASR